MSGIWVFGYSGFFFMKRARKNIGMKIEDRSISTGTCPVPNVGGGFWFWVREQKRERERNNMRFSEPKRKPARSPNIGKSLILPFPIVNPGLAENLVNFPFGKL